MRMIIDTDAGVDDAQAIIMALRHPGVTVEALTTLTGNVHLDWVTRNVFTVLDVMQADVPVYRGAELPLLPGYWTAEERVHGTDGLGNFENRPPTTRRLEDKPAAVALVHMADAAPGEYTLVALGPLTNIALACRLDPDFPHKIRQLVFMGGTINAMGNTKNITAEFNLYTDPEAALIVLEAFPESTMVSWETTIQHPFTWDQYDNLAAIDTAVGRFFRDTSHHAASFLRQLNANLGYLLPDPLAMTVTLKPELIHHRDFRHVTVETQGTLTRGQTIVDHFGLTGHDPNVQVVTGIDVAGVYRLFENMLA